MGKIKEYHELIVMKPTVIAGNYEKRQVWIENKELTPEYSLTIYSHSSNGFDWSNSGDGSAQLALAILLELTKNKKLSIILHHLFKTQFLAPLQRSDFKIKIKIADWFYKNVDKKAMF